MTDTYELEIDIDAPRDRVWGALTDPRQLEEWFCEHAEVSLDDKRYDFWGRFTIETPDRDRGSHRIVDVEPLRVLRFAMEVLGDETTVEITLDGDTKLRILHTDVPLRIGIEAHVGHFWSFAMTQLRGYIEQGRPGPRFDYSWPHHGGFTAHVDVGAPREDCWALLLASWRSPRHLRPARNEDEDFAWDVGVDIGIKILDLVDNEMYSMTWDVGDEPTLLTYSLEDSGGGTRITIVHSGFASDRDIQGMAEGFFSGLVEIAWSAETGASWPEPSEPLVTPFPQPMFAFGVRTLQTAS